MDKGIGLYYEYPLSQISLKSSNDFTLYKHICFIDSAVESAHNFSSFLNNETYPVVYNYDSDREGLKFILLQQFTEIKRVSFAFHGTPDNSSFFTPKSFINNQPFFTGNSSQNYNQEFLQDLFNTLQVTHVDFLACNLLQQLEWKSFFGTFSNVIVGASSDATGNLNYGGDWVMENTMENVRDLYFNYSITNFAVLLITGTYTDPTYGKTMTFITITSNTAEITGLTLQPNSDFSLNIPTIVFDDNFNPYTVTRIGSNAFKNIVSPPKHYLKNVILPSSVIDIGNNAFQSNGQMEINLNHIVTFGSYSFSDCQSLHRNTNGLLTIYGPTRTISSYAFPNCNETSVVIRNDGFNNNLTMGPLSFYHGPNIMTSFIIHARPSITLNSQIVHNCTILNKIIFPNGVVNIPDSFASLCFVIMGVFLYSSRIPTFTRNAFPNSSPKIYFLEDASNTANIPNIFSSKPLTKLLSYNFYKKDTLQSTTALNSKPVGFEIVFSTSHDFSYNDFTFFGGSLNNSMTSDSSKITWLGTFTPFINVSNNNANLSIAGNTYVIQDEKYSTTISGDSFITQGWSTPPSALLNYTVNSTLPVLKTITFPPVYTNSISFSVTIPANTSSWSYSLEGNTTYISTNVSVIATTTEVSVPLTERTYATNQIKVYCTDQAGNDSIIQMNSSPITVDYTKPLLSITAFPIGYSNNHVVSFTLPSDISGWRYTDNGGIVWNNYYLLEGYNTSVSIFLNDGIYGLHAIQVYCTDAAGNDSLIQQNDYLFTIHTPQPSRLVSVASNKLTIGGTPILKNVNNSLLSGRSAMPQKAATSSNENSFSMNRVLYAKTVSTVNTQTSDIVKSKQFFGEKNRDASSVIQRRKIFNSGEKNVSGEKMSYQGTKNISNVIQAQQRVRNR